MSVSNNDRRTVVAASGGQTALAADFILYANDEVTVTRTRSGVDTPLVLTTDYTVSGLSTPAGFTVTLVSGATAGDTYTIEGTRPERSTSAFSTGGDFRATEVNLQLDYAAVERQEIRRDVDDLMDAIGDLDVDSTIITGDLTATYIPLAQDSDGTLADSVMSQSGTTVTLAGGLTVTGSAGVLASSATPLISWNETDAGHVDAIKWISLVAALEWSLRAYNDAGSSSAAAISITRNASNYTLSSIVINEDGGDTDFRVESDGNANAIFVDAGNNRVGILNGSPTVELDVTGAITASGVLIVNGGSIVSAGTAPLISWNETDAGHVDAIKWISLASGLTWNLGAFSDDGLSFNYGISITRNTNTYTLSSVVINENSADCDFRVESDGNANAIFVDAGNNRVGILTGTPSVAFEVAGAIRSQTTTITDATSGRLLIAAIDTTGAASDNIIYYNGSAWAAGALADVSVDLTTDVTGVLPDANVADNLTISAGTINNTPIGQSTAAAGSFTTLTASSTTTLSGSLVVSGTEPNISWNETDAGHVDAIKWISIVESLTWNLGAYSDNGASVGLVLSATRNAASHVLSGIVINESGNDTDFRVESDGNANAIFVDAGNNRVGIMNGAPAVALDVTGACTVSGATTLGSLSVAADTDATSILGRTRVDSRASDNMYLSHFDFSTTSNYALRQDATGQTSVNAATGTNVLLRINNTTVGTISSTGVAVTGTLSATTTLTHGTGFIESAFASPRTITIASGSVAVTSADLHIALDPEGAGTTDTLDYITGGTNGQHLYVRANGNTDQITYTNLAGGGAANSLNTAGADILGASGTWVHVYHFIFNGTSWQLIQ